MSYKFIEETCGCGLDLSTAEPVEVIVGRGNEKSHGQCPSCRKVHFLEGKPEPEAKPVAEPEPIPEPEVVEPAPEPAPE